MGFRSSLQDRNKHVPGLYKTSVCKNWKASGTCPYEDRCQFAHGQQDLKNKPDSFLSQIQPSGGAKMASSGPLSSGPSSTPSSGPSSSGQSPRWVEVCSRSDLSNSHKSENSDGHSDSAANSVDDQGISASPSSTATSRPRSPNHHSLPHMANEMSGSDTSPRPRGPLPYHMPYPHYYMQQQHIAAQIHSLQSLQMQLHAESMNHGACVPDGYPPHFSYAGWPTPCGGQVDMSLQMHHQNQNLDHNECHDHFKSEMGLDLTETETGEPVTEQT